MVEDHTISINLILQMNPGKPLSRGYFISAGLEDMLEFLESFHFEQENLGYLKKTGMFSDDFLHYLSKLQFTGDVYAMPKGQIFFKDEPVLQVTGPINEAQLVACLVQYDDPPLLKLSSGKKTS